MGNAQQSPADRNSNSSSRVISQDVIQQILNKGPISNFFDVDFNTVLGRGHYAIVNLAVDRRTGDHVAVKRIQIARSRLEALKQEIMVLMQVGRHPNIVELKDVFLTETEVLLVMELLTGGELFDRMVEAGPYSEVEASRHIRKIGEALRFIHSKGIVHRDLKPENLLLVDKSPTSELKIADFGLSKIVDNINSATMTTVCGTWAYCSPEVRRPGMMAMTPHQVHNLATPGPEGGAGPAVMVPSYNFKVDLWSTGVILYVILAAFHPFDPDGTCSDQQLWSNICKGVFTFDDPAWEGISEGAKDLIRHLIVVDPEKRYGTEELLRHPWVTQSAEVPRTPITLSIDANLAKFKDKVKRREKMEMED